MLSSSLATVTPRCQRELGYRYEPVRHTTDDSGRLRIWYAPLEVEMREVDLRSDTVTLPTLEMRRAMADAECGDDVWNEDPTVQRLERMAAERMGKEMGIFMPSGTMSNLVAVLGWCRPGEEVIVGSEAHMLWHEVGGASALGGVALRAVRNDPVGRMEPAAVEEAIRPSAPLVPSTSLICLENTHNRCCGGALTPQDTKAVAQVAHDYGIPVHLDGARIFNAAVALDLPAQELASQVDSVSFCISKGLGAPVGSVLCGSEEFVGRARKIRKMLGGGMRQVGVIAAAGIVALESMVSRLAEDHETARKLARGLAMVPGVQLDPERVQTNITILEWVGGPSAEFLEGVTRRGIKVSAMEGGKIRLVTHLGINLDDIDYAVREVGSAAAEIMLKKI
jgi:threonine aldolase